MSHAHFKDDAKQQEEYSAQAAYKNGLHAL
jgi:hypothetical protein